jgi:acyl-CoA synthetase (AMP-forming)/AMP-acid ligase II/acyl carrier protein
MTIHELLAVRARHRPDRIAVLAPGRSPLTYRRLWSLINGVNAWLSAACVRRNDRVAIVLPNGPEMALTFLGVSSLATSAPLNPAYRADDFEFYLRDLNVKALIVQEGTDSPACGVARLHGIPVMELTPALDKEAGVFTLNRETLTGSGLTESAEPGDTALVLHTSGTTSRPKIVPLSHANLCVSAANIRDSLALTEADRCLNVMPFFHIHGLAAALLASLSAGGSVVCTPGFHTSGFFDWMDTFQPTWYTAVPTMHQAILAEASHAREVISRRPLRFIRSSSSSLPPKVMGQLEEAFGAPVIEAYGMTEAAHQIASNPLPPRSRKPGSVGVAAGPEIAIMDEEGKLLECGFRGEIVIRGASVTSGYERNPDANQGAFVNGWFRTGDQGVMDVEGYLSITGRLKEIIKRGGEQIAPREIDEVLLHAPGVRHAVTFGVPHATLGEDVVAAVVPEDGKVLNEPALREFVLNHLPMFKVPSRILIVSEIPKGPTGKLQRIGLNERFAQDLRVAYEPPAEGMEQLTASVIEQVLPGQRVGRNDNFFALGGDSIRAMQVVARLAKTLGLEIPPTAVFQKPTVAQLAGELDRLQEEQEILTLVEELRKLPPEEAERLLREGVRDIE